MKKLCVVILLTTSVAFAGNLYQWTDEKGVKHYSNTVPGDNAEIIPEVKSKPISPAEAARRAREARIEERNEIYERRVEEINRKYDSYLNYIPKPQETPKPSISISSPRWDSNTKTVSISGRVSAYGQSIKLMSIYVYVSDDEGFSAIIHCNLSDITAGSSRIIEGKKKFFGKHGSNWKLDKYEYQVY